MVEGGQQRCPTADRRMSVGQAAMRRPVRGDMADVPQPGGGDDLARRLASARARLAERDLPADVRARLQRQFIAVCDAAKVPGSDRAACHRRLDGFLAALESVVANKSGYKN
jgi:CobQ-like glutamine amidotransferase family enzyme